MHWYVSHWAVIPPSSVLRSSLSGVHVRARDPGRWTRHPRLVPGSPSKCGDVKIAHVTDCYLPRTGGIELQVRDLAAYQRLAGHEVTVLTSTPGRFEPGVRRLPRTHLGRALRDVDAVHAHMSLFSPFAWTGASIGSALGRPTVVTMHSVAPAGSLSRAFGSVAGWREWRVAWTAVSEVAAEPLRAMLDGRDVQVLHNGIDPLHWRVSKDRRPSDELVVVSVMRLTRRKRPVPLVRMFRQHPDSIARVHAAAWCTRW